ncbi:MAG: hypothetical protein LBN25_00385 [Christensenellaceae bacterium]|nr:hypothetical protein [Christensenellaceae bacterium]
MFFALIARVFFVEVIQAQDLQAKALDQWLREVPIMGERGEVYDRNGILLADSYTAYTIYARPVSIKDKNKTLSALVSVLGLDPDKTAEQLSSRKSEVTISKNVTKSQMLSIVESGASGLYFSQTVARYYPFGDFMTQVLGFTNTDGVGQTGAEAYYNAYIEGIKGYSFIETDLVGRELANARTMYVEGKKGATAYLTLDANIQRFTEDAVSRAYAETGAKAAAAIVMDINTGEILAMAQRPSFDLNAVPRDDIATLFANSKSILTSNVYEQGSTFKIITAAAALESGHLSEFDHFYCPGYHIVDGQKIKCWRTIGHGSESFYKAVSNSCNVMFMQAGLNMGADLYYEYIDKFGLKTKTGIDISGEASGLTIPLARVKNVDLARIAFGQAIAVSPIELLVGAAAAVNGGNLVTPYVMKEIKSTAGSVLYSSNPKITSGIVSQKTSDIMLKALTGVVTEGSGKRAAVDGYKIAGKTGTAQKYVTGGGIAQGLYVSSFIGIAPADNPRYICLLFVDEPQGAYYGGVVAAPYVGEIFTKTLAYANVPKTESKIPEVTVPMPDLIGLPVDEAVGILNYYNVYFEVDGEGATVTAQIPIPKVQVGNKSVAVISLG